ncbi:MAG: ImmA/IrrE family metallo-endopeptidase [Bacilli bacterium]
MNFDYVLLGKKLKQSRESLRIEIEEVAQYLDCAQDMVRSFEDGTSQIEGDVLVKLSRLYQRDFRYFVTGNYLSAESQITQLFRANQKLSSLDRKAIQQFIRLCESKSTLEEYLNIQKRIPELYIPSQSGTWSHKSQGAEAAQKERARLSQRGPIPNIYSLLRAQRIHIFRRRLEDRNISGVYIRHPFAGHCILINYDEDIYRQNFSLAHEYGHLLFDSDSEQGISYHQKTQPADMRKLEWRANSFAAHFLVPNELIASLTFQGSYSQTKDQVLRLCHHFGVSSQVMIIRLKEQGNINPELLAQLSDDKGLIIPRNQKPDPEFNDVSPKLKEIFQNIVQKGLSIEYIELCRKAYHEGEISYSKMLESIGLPFEEAQQVSSLWNIIMEVE